MESGSKKISVTKVRQFSGHDGAIYALEQSADPSYFFSGSGDHFVSAWSLEKTEPPKAIVNVGAIVYSICFVPGKNILLIGTSTGGLHVVDLDQKKEIKFLVHHKGGIFDIKYSSSQNNFFTASGDGILASWSAEDFSLLNSVKLCDAKIRSIDLHPSENILAVSCGDGHIKILTPDLKEVNTIDAHQLSANCVKFHPDGKYLLSGGRDAHLNVWDVKNNFELLKKIPAHNFAIYSIVFSPDKKLFATGSRDKTIKIWTADDFDFLTRIDKENFSGHVNSVNKLLWTDFNNYLLSAGDDRSVIAWRIEPEII